MTGNGNGNESYMSLNTTVSNPSQYPPTADQSSLLNLPRWSIPLSKLTPLSTLLARPRSNANRNGEMVNTIVCVLSVDQPVLRKRKEEKARGRDATLWIGNWSVTAPPPAGSEREVGSCAVKLWDKVAQEWGDERVRKGDVVLLESMSHVLTLLSLFQSYQLTCRCFIQARLKSPLGPNGRFTPDHNIRPSKTQNYNLIPYPPAILHPLKRLCPRSCSPASWTRSRRRRESVIGRQSAQAGFTAFKE
jgi:hypothetical protein